MKRRPWPVATKAEAMALAAEHGPQVASDRTGVPVGTVKNWCHRTAGQAVAVLETTTVGVSPEAAAQSWQTRRGPLLEEIGSACTELLGKARECARDGKLRDARDASVSLGILIDKAQLLSGAATSRHDSRTLSVNVEANREDVEAEIEELERRLGIR